MNLLEWVKGDEFAKFHYGAKQLLKEMLLLICSIMLSSFPALWRIDLIKISLKDCDPELPFVEEFPGSNLKRNWNGGYGGFVFERG